MPAPAIRRVVTGHNAQGLAVVAVDEIAQGSVVTQGWMTDTLPSNNVDDFDAGMSQPGASIPGGSALRLADMSPGYRSAMHRTSTIDYVFILSGELDMELDGGETVHLKGGDIVVQRGTNHRWVNNSDAICRFASVLIKAEPVVIDGKVLEPTMV